MATWRPHNLGEQIPFAQFQLVIAFQNASVALPTLIFQKNLERERKNTFSRVVSIVFVVIASLFNTGQAKHALTAH